MLGECAGYFVLSTFYVDIHYTEEEFGFSFEVTLAFDILTLKLLLQLL